MMTWLLRFAFYLLDSIKVILIMNYFFGVKVCGLLKRTNFYGGLLLMATGAYIHNRLYDNYDFNTFYFLMMMMICLLFFGVYATKTFMQSLGVIFLVKLMDIIFSILITLIDDLNGFYENRSAILIGSVLTIGCIISLGKDLRKKNIAFSTIDMRTSCLLVTILIADTVILSYFLEYVVEKSWTSNKILFFSIYLFLAMFLISQLGLIIYLWTLRDLYKSKERLNKHFLMAQKQHFDYLKERHEKMRKFRHDIASHMYMLGKYLDTNNAEKAREYFTSIQDEIMINDHKIFTNNDIVDAIINKFYSEAVKKDIKFEVSGRMPVECPIDAFDLCTIFANLLSNAFEAVEESKEKMIQVFLRYDDAYIYIKEENPYVHEIKKTYNHIITNKEDKQIHGLGLLNIEESVKKYDGTMDINYDGHKFIIMISIKYGQKNAFTQDSSLSRKSY